MLASSDWNAVQTLSHRICLQGPSAPEMTGVPEGIRTPDPRFRKPVLYPAELPRHQGVGSIGIGRFEAA